MPWSSKRKCAHPGCDVLVQAGRCAKHEAALVPRDQNIKKLYNDPRWKTIREIQLALNPWCMKHLALGFHVAATEVHHKEPHRGDPVKFFAGPFESLCKPCHSGETAREVGWHSDSIVLPPV